MKYFLFFSFFINILFSQNNYPIVLIHGFFGWGNDEMGSYRYWGGNKDIQKMYEKNGFISYIDKIYAFNDFKEAHQHVYDGHKVGNVVMVIKEN